MNLWLCLIGFLLVGSFGFIILSISLLKSNRPLAKILLLVNVSGLLFLFAGPDLSTLSFHLFRSKYEETVKLIESGFTNTETRRYSQVESGYLPFPYKYLGACGGKFLYQEDNDMSYVFFFHMVDWLSFSGYLHSTNGQLPDKFFYIGLHHPSEDICREMLSTPNWYFCEFID